MNNPYTFLHTATDDQIAAECKRRLKLAVDAKARENSPLFTRAQALTAQGTLYNLTVRNADGTALRCRVNGKCQTWVTRPTEFRLPVKRGLKNSFYITDCTAHQWSLVEPKYAAAQRTAAV